MTARGPTGAPAVMRLGSALSLDAPVVALLWQALFAQALGANLGWPGRAVLGLAVWVIYAADRWFDGRRMAPGSAVTPRHRFAVRHRKPLAVAILVAAACGLSLALTRLEAHVIRLGLLLGAAVAFYFVLNQATPRGWGLRLPKEVAGAVLFAGGTLLLPMSRASQASLWGLLACLLFGFLCLVNLVAVAAWDRAADEAQGQASVALSRPWVLRALPTAAWATAIAGLALAWLTWESRALATVALCEAASGVGLGVLLADWGPASPELRALAADVVLLTPLPVLLWTAWGH